MDIWAVILRAGWCYARGTSAGAERTFPAVHLPSLQQRAFPPLRSGLACGACGGRRTAARLRRRKQPLTLRAALRMASPLPALACASLFLFHRLAFVAETPAAGHHGGGRRKLTSDCMTEK